MHMGSYLLFESRTRYPFSTETPCVKTIAEIWKNLDNFYFNSTLASLATLPKCYVEYPLHLFENDERIYKRHGMATRGKDENRAKFFFLKSSFNCSTKWIWISQISSTSHFLHAGSSFCFILFFRECKLLLKLKALILFIYFFVRFPIKIVK